MTPIQPLDRTASDFRAKVDTLFEVQIPLFTTEINEVIEQLNGAEASEAAAAASASAAAAAAETASLIAGASLWVSGATYAKGVHVISPSNLQTYARRAAGAGTTDPSGDPTNWELKSGYTSFNPVAMAALDINCALGNFFYKTVTTSSTLTISNVPPAGFSFTLEVKLDAGSIALPASVTAPGGTLPTLATGKTHLLMFVTRDGGARWRVAAANNYQN